MDTFGWVHLPDFSQEQCSKGGSKEGRTRRDTGRRYRETDFQRTDLTCNIILLKSRPISGGNFMSWFWILLLSVLLYSFRAQGKCKWRPDGLFLRIWRGTDPLSKLESRFLWVNLDANILRNLILTKQSLVLSHGLSLGATELLTVKIRTQRFLGLQHNGYNLRSKFCPMEATESDRSALNQNRS